MEVPEAELDDFDLEIIDEAQPLDSADEHSGVEYDESGGPAVEDADDAAGGETADENGGREQ